MLEDFQRDRPHFVRAAAVTAAAATAANSPTPAPAPAATASSSSGTTINSVPAIDAAAGGSGTGGSAAGSSGSDSGSQSDGITGGMSAVMACYEKELQSPIRNLVAGDLARTLLIQVRVLEGRLGAGVRVCHTGGLAPGPAATKQQPSSNYAIQPTKTGPFLSIPHPDSNPVIRFNASRWTPKQPCWSWTRS